MIPGLQMHDLPDPALCSTLEEIKSDAASRSLSEYLSSGCPEECRVHHIVLYLENVLEAGKVRDAAEITGLLDHPSPKIRKLSLLICCRYLPDEAVPSSLQNDPSAMVRSIYLRFSSTANEADLIKQTRDANPEVRACALERLAGLQDRSELKLDILKAVCCAINDRELRIRTIASEAIGLFTDLPADVVQQLHSKQVKDYKKRALSGALIYGLEDEYLVVRKNTIRSLYSLARPEVLPQTFELLVDMLNDDDESLRELCTEYLRLLSERYELHVEMEMLLQICSSLEERSHRVRENVLVLLSNLNYRSSDVFDILIGHMNRNIEPKRIFACVRLIVGKNGEVFYQSLDKFHRYTEIAQIEPSLSDPLHVARLVVIKELGRLGYEFMVSRAVEEHLLFIDVMEAAEARDGIDAGFFKDILCQYLDERGDRPGAEKNYRRMFSLKKCRDPSYRFMSFLFKAISAYPSRASEMRLRYLSYKFENSDLDFSSMEDISSYIRSIDLSKIRALRYQLSMPSEISVRPCFPFKLTIHALVEKKCPKIRIKVVSPEKKGRHYYPLEERTEVCLHENEIVSVHACVVLLDGETEIRLSKMSTTHIVRRTE
jgi:integrator complex subunit 4